MQQETGWLIEMKNEYGYVSWANFQTGDGSVRWESDSLLATRFCRKEDAIGLIEYMGYEGPNVFATEHIWG